MDSLRAFIRDHRRFAALIVALALCMKAFVPGGYMLSQQGKVLTISICADASGAKAMTQQIVITPDSKAVGHAKSDSPCPYAMLGMAALNSGDLSLWMTALAFILSLGFAPVRLVRLANCSFLRPPLRGPPERV